LTDGQTKSTYITTNFIPKPNQSDITADRISNRNLDILETVETFEFEKFFDVTTINFSKESTDITTDISYTLYIAENRRHECPKLLIKIRPGDICIN
jgi:hypothetical protein